MKYVVKDEYIDQWYGDLPTDEIEDAQLKGFTDADIANLSKDWDIPVETLMEQVEEAGEIVLEISRIAIKSETFCTPWNGKLYCVDICEDSEERSAWLYNVNYGVKSLMWGEEINQQSRGSFLDLVFSKLPDYIEDYEEEYED